MQTPAYALLGILILAALSRKWSLPFLPSFQILLGSTLLALAVITIMGLESDSWYPGVTVIVCQVFFYGVIVLWRFYRDPERIPPDDPDGVLSPADGRVIYIRRTGGEQIPTSEKSKHTFALEELKRSSLAGREVWHIGISMVFTDVHVNRSPIAGKVSLIHRRPGRFLSLRHHEALGVNERQTLVIENGHVQVGVVQIASRLVRRIQAFVSQGDSVQAGQRIGVIKFGSQVDLIIPVDVVQPVGVCLGQTLVAGQTVICRLSPVSESRALGMPECISPQISRSRISSQASCQ